MFLLVTVSLVTGGGGGGMSYFSMLDIIKEREGATMIKEKAEKEITEWIEYRERAVEDLKSIKPALLRLATLLDTVGVEDGDTNLSYNSIRVIYPTVTEARTLVGKLLQDGGIKEFTKSWESCGDKINWGYEMVTEEGINLKVFPCEPNQECLPVKRTSTYTNWVCERRER
jgi:hypothetical protein